MFIVELNIEQLNLYPKYDVLLQYELLTPTQRENIYYNTSVKCK